MPSVGNINATVSRYVQLTTRVNRAAQADDVRARIEYRQAEVGLDQTSGNVKP